MSERENGVIGMQKDTDSEEVKMMQLLTQRRAPLSQRIGRARFSPSRLYYRGLKKTETVPTPLLINSHFQVLKAFASFLFSIRVNQLLQNHGVLAKLHHWGG